MSKDFERLREIARTMISAYSQEREQEFRTASESFRNLWGLKQFKIYRERLGVFVIRLNGSRKRRGKDDISFELYKDYLISGEKIALCSGSLAYPMREKLITDLAGINTFTEVICSLEQEIDSAFQRGEIN